MDCGKEVTKKITKRCKRCYTAYSSGSNSHSWKGGEREHAGYILVYKKDHSNCSSTGYCPKHRLVMEEHLGRFLLETEVVHHIDGDKHNNNIGNLRLYNSQAEHVHDNRYKGSKRCLVCKKLFMKPPFESVKCFLERKYCCLECRLKVNRDKKGRFYA